MTARAIVCGQEPPCAPATAARLAVDGGTGSIVAALERGRARLTGASGRFGAWAALEAGWRGRCAPFLVRALGAEVLRDLFDWNATPGRTVDDVRALYDWAIALAAVDAA